VRVPFGPGTVTCALQSARRATPTRSIRADPGDWTQLNNALHRRAPKGNPTCSRDRESEGIRRQGPAVGCLRSAPATAPAERAVLTAAQWDQLIARIAVLPMPKVAVSRALRPSPILRARANSAGGERSLPLRAMPPLKSSDLIGPIRHQAQGSEPVSARDPIEMSKRANQSTEQKWRPPRRQPTKSTRLGDEPPRAARR